MHIHVIDHNTSHKALIAKLIVAAVPHVERITFSKTKSDHSEDLRDCDLVVVTGGTWLVHKNPVTHRKVIEEILKTKKPVISICLGAEAFAQYFGASLVELDERISGIINIDIKHPYSKHIGETLDVYEHHRWVIRDLPDCLQLVADSKYGVEAFYHKELPIWGFQFHPEVWKNYNSGRKLFHLAAERLINS